MNANISNTDLKNYDINAIDHTDEGALKIAVAFVVADDLGLHDYSVTNKDVLTALFDQFVESENNEDYNRGDVVRKLIRKAHPDVYPDLVKHIIKSQWLENKTDIDLHIGSLYTSILAHRYTLDNNAKTFIRDIIDDEAFFSDLSERVQVRVVVASFVAESYEDRMAYTEKVMQSGFFKNWSANAQADFFQKSIGPYDGPTEPVVLPIDKNRVVYISPAKDILPDYPSVVLVDAEEGVIFKGSFHDTEQFKQNCAEKAASGGPLGKLFNGKPKTAHFKELGKETRANIVDVLAELVTSEQLELSDPLFDKIHDEVRAITKTYNEAKVKSNRPLVSRSGEATEEPSVGEPA